MQMKEEIDILLYDVEVGLDIPKRILSFPN